MDFIIIIGIQLLLIIIIIVSMIFASFSLSLSMFLSRSFLCNKSNLLSIGSVHAKWLLNLFSKSVKKRKIMWEIFNMACFVTLLHFVQIHITKKIEDKINSPYKNSSLVMNED